MNLDEINILNSEGGNYSIEFFFFKNNLINLILLNNNLNSKVLQNDLDLVYINFKTNFTIKEYKVGSVNIMLDGIICQKSLIYKNFKQGFTSYNIISYKLNNNWVSENNFKRGQIYYNLKITSDFKGINNKTENEFIIRPKVKFLNITNSVEINLDNLLYFPNKDMIIGYKNDFQKNIFTYIPLLRGFEEITVTIRTKNTSKQYLFLENNNSFTIPKHDLSKNLLETNINTRTLDITKKEVIDALTSKFEEIEIKIKSNTNLYNYDYDSGFSLFKLNIISLRFFNNFSQNQKFNKILINTNTNPNIDRIYRDERLDSGREYSPPYIWGENLVLHTKDSYFDMKIAGITQARLSELNFENIKLDILIINNNENVIDIFLHIPTSNSYKIYKNTDDYEDIEYNNNYFQIIPKAKNIAQGLNTTVSVKILEANNSLFDNILIDDIEIKIAGIKSNISNILINLNKLNLETGEFDNSLSGPNYETIYSESLRINTVDDDFFNLLAIRDNDNFIDPDTNDINELLGKNPKINDLLEIVTRRYKIKVIDNTNNYDILLERSTLDDKGIIDIDRKSLISPLNPNINVIELEKIFFDLSDISMFKKTIKFYKDITCKNELIYENFIEHAKYSRNYISGENGSNVIIEIPYIENNELGITEINNKIYYKIIDVNKSNPKTSPVGFINIIFRRRLHHGEIDIEDILPNQQNSGLVKYINEGLLFYDPGEIKPRIDISFNKLFTSNVKTYFVYSNNIFNNLEYKDIDDGTITLSMNNVNSFIGDNMFVTENTFNKFEEAFYVENKDMIDGSIRIGISFVGNNNFNNALFEKNGEYISVKQYPSDIEQTEIYKSNLNNTINNTNYILYVTSRFAESNQPKKVDFMIKYGSYNSSDYISQQFLKEDKLSSDYNGATYDNLYLCGYVKNNILYVSLIVIMETNNIITYFNKINESEMHTTKNEILIGDIFLKLAQYKDATKISGQISDINTKYYYNSNLDSLKLGYVRKAFNFIPKIKSNENNIENCILFQPLNNYFNKDNHSLQKNEYLVAFFESKHDGFRNVEYIYFFKIILTHYKPHFSFVGNDSKGRIVNTENMSDVWYGTGTKHGLFLTKPIDLINIYLNKKNATTFVTDNDNVINTPNENFYLDDFILPVFDSNKYNNFSIEVDYIRNLYEDARVDFKIYKQNNILINRFSVYKRDNLSNYSNIFNRPIPFEIDPSGQIIIALSGIANLSSLNERIETPYILTYQINNRLSNDFIGKLTESKKFFNFTETFGQVRTYTKGEKTVLNIKKFRTPLKLNDNETDLSKNEFNNFLQNNNVNTVINRQSDFILKKIKHQDRRVDSDRLIKTGIGKIIYKSEEYNSSGNIDISSAYTGIFGDPINFNVVNLGTIQNIQSEIINNKEVNLKWDYFNDNLTVEILFVVYRSQDSTTEKKYIEIGRTKNRYFRDYTAVPFLKVFYKLESIAMWRGIEMNTGTSYHSTFICENNNFKFGRYNNTTENPKLYKPINTSCNKIGMEGISKTGNLFPNSVTLTKKELYTELSRAKFRPFR